MDDDHFVDWDQSVTVLESDHDIIREKNASERLISKDPTKNKFLGFQLTSKDHKETYKF